jgi:hypothetical protein
MGDIFELKVLISRVLLPRIIQLENEVASLRRDTWPYIQAKKEDTGMRNMDELANFLKHLDDDTILKLLRLKNQFTRNPGLPGREIDMITQLRNNFC